MPGEASPTRVVTGKVRLSYAHLFEPYAVSPESDVKKYSTVIMIPKRDKVTVSKLRKAQRAALEAGRSKAFGGSIPKNWKDTIHDGDDEDQTDLEKNPELEGHLYLTVASKTRPGVVDRDLTPLTDPDDVYSGCYARVSLEAFAFNQQGNKGVSFGLRHVQKLADGERLDGRSSPEDDFDSLDEDEDDML